MTEEVGWIPLLLFAQLVPKTLPEYDMYMSIHAPHGKWFVPLMWILNLLKQKLRERRIDTVRFSLTATLCNCHWQVQMTMLVDQLYKFRDGFAMLYVYDWVKIPLVYTQVGCIFQRQICHSTSFSGGGHRHLRILFHLLDRSTAKVGCQIDGAGDHDPLSHLHHFPNALLHWLAQSGPIFDEPLWRWVEKQMAYQLIIKINSLQRTTMILVGIFNEESLISITG